MSTFRKEKADLLMQSHIQHPNESVLVYVEEMKRLFCCADPSMSEERKVRFLMKGVKKQLFAGLVRSPPVTVDDFIKEVTSIEKSLDMRARQYERTTMLMQSASTEESTITSAVSLRDTIRVILREELAKLLQSPVQL